VRVREKKRREGGREGGSAEGRGKKDELYKMEIKKY
jgi:hypothetical protein